jgi:serine/threonine protein kinase
MEDFEGILDDKWNLLETIGFGGTSKVYKGYKNEDTEKKIFAIKTVDPQKTNIEYFEKEIEILKKLNHTNIMKVIEYGEGVLKLSEGTTTLVNYIILEYYKYGELFEYVVSGAQGLGEEIGREIFLKLLDILEDCHTNDIIHRDLKTSNIMVTDDYDIIISDFGFATYNNIKNDTHNKYLGTAGFKAPEIEERTPYYGEQVDIFSLGVTLFTIVVGPMPFERATAKNRKYSHIYNNDIETYNNKYLKNSKLSDDFKSLFFSMVSYNYTKRPSIEDIKSHSWLNERKDDWGSVSKELKRRRPYAVKLREMIMRVHKKNKVTITLKCDSDKYRSSSNNDQDNDIIEKQINLDDKVIENYEKANNPYTIKIKNDIGIDELYCNIIEYLKNQRKYTIKDKSKKYSLIIKPDDNEEEDYDDFKIRIDIKKDYDSKLIIEFIRIRGNKFTLYEIYSNFLALENKENDE